MQCNTVTEILSLFMTTMSTLEGRHASDFSQAIRRPGIPQVRQVPTEVPAVGDFSGRYSPVSVGPFRQGPGTVYAPTPRPISPQPIVIIPESPSRTRTSSRRSRSPPSIRDAPTRVGSPRYLPGQSVSRSLFSKAADPSALRTLDETANGDISSVATMQQKHLELFNEAQSRRQKMFNSEMQRYNRIFAVNDLRRNEEFQRKKLQQQEQVEERENQQRLLFKDLMAKEQKGFRAAILKSETRFRTNESYRETQFMESQRRFMSDFSNTRDNIQDNCYKDSTNRMVQYQAWEAEVRASAEWEINKWRTRFDMAERARSEMFENIVAAMMTVG